MSRRPPEALGRIRTGGLERRWSLARAGLVAGARYAARATGVALRGGTEAQQRAVLGEEAERLVRELGALKGSVVKVGQMMALYGEHFLPAEITRALHSLENQTTPMSWTLVRRELSRELGRTALDGLDIDPQPLAAASLGQVHRARRRSDGKHICLKIQYPGVASSIDADIDAVVSLLRITAGLRRTQGFDDWVSDVRTMLHAEVDYRLEAEQTRRFAARLRRDRIFVVPEVIDEYSRGQVIATAYARGHRVGEPALDGLPQHRRNALGRAFLELFMREVFEWGEMQTDPNFGNYLVRPALRNDHPDRLVLLDFAAVRAFPEQFMTPFREMIRGAYAQDLEQVRRGAIGLDFIREDYPEEAQLSFSRICASVIEPLVARPGHAPASLFNPEGAYRWGASDLPERVAREAGRAVFDRQFRLPAREFMFLNRKLIGVYTFISVIGAEFNGADIIERYL